MYPGEGAVEYARALVAGLTREQAAVKLAKPSDDPRVKRCAGCGYHFRDKTKPGNARVCGPTCKTAVKSAQRSIQRPKKGTTARPKKPILYYYWHEYPFWISEWAMLRHVGSYERPHSPEKIAQIMAAKDRTERMGGRKRHSNVTNL